MSIKTAMAAVAIIVGIYVVNSVRAAANSPAGKAVSSILGTAASLLTAIAGLPPWLLVGLGFAYLLGPAVLKMGGGYVRKMAAAVKEFNAKAAAKKAAGSSDDEVAAYAEGAVSQSAVRIREAQAAGAGAAEQERLAQAQQSRATVIEAATAAGHAAAAEEGTKDADEVFE